MSLKPRLSRTPPAAADPTYSSWLNLVERWFAELTNKWLRRSTHRSVRALTDSIRTWVAEWNDNPRPFVWHKTSDQILIAPRLRRGSQQAL